MKFKKIVVTLLIFLLGFVESNSVKKEFRCGTRSIWFERILGGHTQVRAWPWLVSFRDQVKNNFFCAGTLVSSKHVISAAHCFERKRRREDQIKSPLDVTAWVGKHNLRILDEEGSVAHSVWEIVIHEDWDFESDDFDADISLIVLETEVDLSQRNYVRIICLPPASQAEVSGIGTVVGWGVSERSVANAERHDSTPNEFKLPAVTREQCIAADEAFDAVLTPRSFCAGFLNQNKSACQGDSGGGLFQYDSEKKSYNLAGIVSSSRNDLYGKCRGDSYSVFTTVGKFIDWIERKMEETKEKKWIEVELKCENSEINEPTHHCVFDSSQKVTRNLKVHQSSTGLFEELHVKFNPSPYMFAGIGENFPNLKKMWCFYQDIKYLERRIFENMEKLEYLNLAVNKIELVRENTFDDLVNLKNLVLFSNKIKRLPDNVFYNLRNLEVAWIHGNQISSLQYNIFSSNSKLKEVLTYDNKLRTTNDIDFSKFPDLKLQNETWNGYYQHGRLVRDDSYFL